MSNQTETKIYAVKNYGIREKDFIKYETSFNTVDTVCNELETDKSYHLRLKKGNNYIFYLDLDGYQNSIDKFLNDLKLFFNEKYNIILEDKNIKYTQNEGKKGSHHISIPMINCTTEKQKEIIINLSKYVNTETKKCVDTTVYCDKWFRLPNQTKGVSLYNKKDAILTKHNIINGKMKDFILNYIPEKSKNIEDVKYLENENEKEKTEKKKKKEENEKVKINNEIKKKTQNDTQIYNTTQIETIEKLLNILDCNYYDSFEFWRNIAFILKKYEQNTNNKMFDLFDKFSQKSKKYNSIEVKKFYDKLESYNIKFNINTLYYYARICNLDEYKKIVKDFHEKTYITITEKYLAEKIKEMAGHLFFFKNENFYCFNNKNNLWYENKSEILKKYINDELYDFMKYFINDAIDDKSYYHEQKKILENLCTSNKGQENIIKTFKNRFFTDENDIKFDTKHYLVGFSNGVYDLIKNEFRQYRYNDYMTTQTGYPYKEPKKEEIETLKNIINEIEPNEEKKHLLFQLYSTGLIGKSYPKFILLNGSGGNGKSFLTSFIQTSLGNYYYKGDIKSLTTDKDMEANPAIASMHKKRYVNFTEPKVSKKINNGTLKTLTGDKTINARKLFSNDTNTILHLTLFLECNKKIFFEDEPTEGEIRRTIDYLFESKFTEDNDKIDNDKRIFKANKKYEDDEFIEQHKYAFINILIKYAHDFLTIENEEFKVPESIKKRTEEYINKSYLPLELLNEICECTDNKEDYVKISDFYSELKYSDSYINLTKEQKRNLNLKSIITFFESHKKTRNNYKEIHQPLINGKQKLFRNSLIGYKFTDKNDLEEED
jgi:phage/plasmid-associated DNA primase